MPVGKRRVTFTVLARLDFNQIVRYSAEIWGEEQGIGYSDAILDAIDRLVDHPFLGAKLIESENSRRKLKAQSHLVFYRVTTTEIRILRILHERADDERAYLSEVT